ncbi:MAG: AmmeMemoRadiSam system protein A [Thiotrichales bacterium]
MALTSSNDLTLDLQARLLDLAETSIRHGLAQGRACPVAEADFDATLREPRATFVTLRRHGQLRGCIGGLTAHQSLVRDVAEHAYAAAFSDPRFTPLQSDELAGLEISISILSPPEPLTFHDQDDLLRQIRPEVDGLILQAGEKRGTFLPSVWSQLPRREDFVRELKRKAGLPADYWSDHLVVARYTTAAVGPRTLAT